MIMKKRIYCCAILLCTFIAPLLVSCEEDLPVYKSDEAGLKFIFRNKEGYTSTRDTLTNYSFAYDVIDVDTVWLKVQILGSAADKDREITLKQSLTGENDAIAGEHFVPFDDAELKEKFYFIPKGEMQRDIPIVLKRAASLKEMNYTLRLIFELNDDFTFVDRDWSFKRFTLSDQLIKPNKWDSYCKYFLGTYGPVKHDFIIKHSGQKWDDKYVDEVWVNYFMKDQNYCFYFNGAMSEALAAYEAEYGRLYEEGNIPVTFPKF